MNIIQRVGSDVDLDDFYCGAGGETTGAKKLGINVRHAFNHEPIAIETHNTNHPETTHICADIGTYDPTSYKGSVMAWFSPECKTFSLARGKSQKPMQQLALPGDEWDEYDLTEKQERSRVTAGDILRHVQVHRYQAMVVENVVQFRQWEKFDSWLQELMNLGYEWEIVYLNSMFCHPTPQSRDRMYVCLWRKGNRKPDLDIRPRAWCEQCGHDIDSLQMRKPTASAPYMRYKEQYVYVCPVGHGVVEPYYFAAANVIDFTNIGQRIGDRKKPLSENTMERIRYGLEKFGSGVLETAYTQSGQKRSSALYHAMPTQTSQQSLGVFLSLYHNDTGDRCHSVSKPMPTVDGNPRFGLVGLPPFMLGHYNNIGPARTLDDPMFTMATRNLPTLVIPPFLTSVNKFSEGSRTVDGPMFTQTTSEKHGITIPPLIVRAFTDASPTSVEEGLPTVVANGIHHWLLNNPAFLAEFYRCSNVQGVHEPMPTQATKPHHGLVSNLQIEPEDCYFRMLTPEEIKWAMGFPRDYVLLGTQRDQVMLAGQAVTPDAATVLLERMLETLQ